MYVNRDIEIWGFVRPETATGEAAATAHAAARRGLQEQGREPTLCQSQQAQAAAYECGHEQEQWSARGARCRAPTCCR